MYESTDQVKSHKLKQRAPFQTLLCQAFIIVSFFFILLSLVCGVSGSVGVRKRLHKGLQQSPFPIISRLDRCVHIRKHFIQNRQYMQRKTRDTDEENKTGENRPER